MDRYKKFLGTVLGGITGGGVIWAVHLFGGSVTESAAVAIAGGLAALGTLFAPAQGAGW